MHLRFDENDDVVVEDVPDDLMRQLEQLAVRHRRAVEDEMRDLFLALVDKWSREEL